MPGRHRPFVVQVIVNAAERDEIHRAAERNLMSASAYARSRLLLAIRREAKLEQQIEQRLGILEPAEA
jgi:hypothetical protein